MIGKLVSALAGRSLARTIGGVSAGPVGAAVGLAVPVLLPTIARRLGPVGMIAAAVGSVAFARWMERRAIKQGRQLPVPITGPGSERAAEESIHLRPVSAPSAAARGAA